VYHEGGIYIRRLITSRISNRWTAITSSVANIKFELFAPLLPGPYFILVQYNLFGVDVPSVTSEAPEMEISKALGWGDTSWRSYRPNVFIQSKGNVGYGSLAGNFVWTGTEQEGMVVTVKHRFDYYQQSEINMSIDFGSIVLIPMDGVMVVPPATEEQFAERANDDGDFDHIAYAELGGPTTT
jgi:hypothetical protein